MTRWFTTGMNINPTEFQHHTYRLTVKSNLAREGKGSVSKLHSKKVWRASTVGGLACLVKFYDNPATCRTEEKTMSILAQAKNFSSVRKRYSHLIKHSDFSDN